MKKRAVLLVASVLMLTGCGGKEKALELERQKLTLELMKSQNEQLAVLTQKESDVRALEKKNQETLQAIERQRAELHTSQEKMKATIAEEDARLRAEKERLAKEAKRWAEVERQQSEAMERTNRRQHALEELALMVIARITQFDQPTTRKHTRSEMEKELVELFRTEKVAEFDHEEDFVSEATRVAEVYTIMRSGRDFLQYSKPRVDEALKRWATAYLQSAGSRGN